ncbi:MAG: response regulator transcription factor [Elusimicrobiota bacterium]
MIRSRILVVEDDEGYQDVFKLLFGCHGEEFSWILARSGEKAIERLKDHSHTPIDAVLLDCQLPGALDGLQVLRFIRSNPAMRCILVIMVTGNKSGADVDAAFESGADDYVIKPFRENELLLRLRGHLRRRDMVLDTHGAFELDELKLDIEDQKVTLNGKLLHLYPTEIALLKLFLKSPDRILSAQYLWEKVRGYPSDTAAVVLSKHIGNLRKKLGRWGERLETLRDQGYLLNTRFPLLNA